MNYKQLILATLLPSSALLLVGCSSDVDSQGEPSSVFEGFVNGSMGENVKARIALKTIQSSEGWQIGVDGGDELSEKYVTALRASSYAFSSFTRKLGSAVEPRQWRSMLCGSNSLSWRPD